MYYDRWTMKNIVDNILKENVTVKYTYGVVSSVNQTLLLSQKKIIKSTRVNYFCFSLQDLETQNAMPYLLEAHRELFSNYDPKLWVILHEIGHVKTSKGLSFKQWKKDESKLQEQLKSKKNQHEINVFFRKMTPERRADKWAYEWALKHPKECECISENLRVSKS